MWWKKVAGGNSIPRRSGGGGSTPQYRGEPRGNPPRTVWLTEREEHEQVISKIPKIKQTTGDTRGRKKSTFMYKCASKQCNTTWKIHLKWRLEKVLENIAKKGARGKSSTCLAHIELKWIPGVTFGLKITYKTRKNSLSVFLMTTAAHLCQK